MRVENEEDFGSKEVIATKLDSSEQSKSDVLMYLWEESDSVCIGLSHSIPGFVHYFHFSLQQFHEVYLIYFKFKATYDGNHDTFRAEFLVVPVGGLSFLVNHDFSPME
eukprot:g41994.t1